MQRPSSEQAFPPSPAPDDGHEHRLARRFARRAIGGFAALVVVALSIGLIASVMVRGAVGEQRRVYEAQRAELAAVRSVEVQAERLVAAKRGYLLTRERKFLDTMRAAGASLEVALASLEDVQHEELAVDVARVRDAARRYRISLQRAVDGDKLRTTSDVEAWLWSTTPHRMRLDAAVTSLVAHRDQWVADAHAKAERRERTSFATILVLSALGALLAVVLARVFYGQLVRLYAAEARARESAANETEVRKTLLGIVAHDLRTPLSSIALNAELLERTATTGAAASRAQSIRLVASGMERIIAGLLDSASIEAGAFTVHRRRVPAAALLAQVCQLFGETAARAGIRLDVRLDPEGLEVICDPELVERVLGNLVGNAMKFTPSGGSILVSASAVAQRVRFEVKDSGGGIPPDQQEHLFERFWMAPNGARKGAGLGLYIANGIVQAHGGRLGVSSAEGAGSTFFFELEDHAQPGTSDHWTFDVH